jgi:tRNA A37 threonylcarbamoyladenosine modification protein TsaB
MIDRGTWLLLDAAGPRVQTGVLRGGRWLAFTAAPGAALDLLFAQTDAGLARAGLPLAAIDGFIYGRGPGSMLGLRLAAMAIATWRELAAAAAGPAVDHPRPLLVYHSLEAAARLLRHAGAAVPLGMLAPWRRDRHHWLHLAADGACERGARADSDALPAGAPPYWLDLRSAADRPAPEGVVPTAYDLEQLPLLPDLARLLEPADQPVPWIAENPSYALWTPQRHRGRLG